MAGLFIGFLVEKCADFGIAFKNELTHFPLLDAGDGLKVASNSGLP